MFTHIDSSTYTIIDGLRRSKIADYAGHSTILAKVLEFDGTKLGECDLPVDALLSIRDTVPWITPPDQTRWFNLLVGAQEVESPFPPIIVQRGTRGKPLWDVEFEFGDQSDCSRPDARRFETDSIVDRSSTP